jgi:cyclic 2,3-diphosphoglycerate synthetase
LRTLVLVDGEHYPPVVRAAIEHISSRIPGCVVVGAALLGGREKIALDGTFDIGVPLVVGSTPEDAMGAAMARFAPELVLDLSDQPVVDLRVRMNLVTVALLNGVPYQGADFRFDPPPRPRVATKPSVAVIGTGKRAGKTAVSAHLARLLAARGTPPVIIAMGRGGPAEPELVDPATFDLSPKGLVELALSGRHAASDHLEDALTAGVVTIGTRRCGGGMAGAPADSTFADGVSLANARPERLFLLEGSGQAIPPVHADATICVVPADGIRAVTEGLGPYRVLLSDLVVITMVEAPFADSGAADLEGSVRGVAPGVRVARIGLRPYPLEPVSGRTVFYVTTAPASAIDLMVGHLEREHGCTVVGTSSHLAHRPKLAEDLERADAAEVLLVELKAAAVDLAARVALERGLEVVFCDNRVVSLGGDGSFDELALATTDLAVERHHP